MGILRKSSRLIYTLIAVGVGFSIVYGLTLVGEQSKGPIETVLTKASEKVQTVEEDIILDKREAKRSDNLVWFEKIKNSKQKLLSSKIILFGASDSSSKDSFENILTLEDSLKTTFPLIHIYAAWGGKQDEQFPSQQVDAIYELGSLPVITWEPWVTDFDETKMPGIGRIEDREKGSMTQVAAGKYDSYIKTWAKEAKSKQKPIYVRLGHEMNEPYRYPWGPQNNTPQEFVAGWKHIHDIFTSMGATNVIWIWSPHLAYGYFNDYYPGSDYVDIVGTGVLNYGTATSWSQWWTFKEIFGAHYQELSNFNKPIMIAEFGSLNTGGSRNQWFKDALTDLPNKYPAIKSILYFHYSGDKTTTDRAVNWQIKKDPSLTKTIRNEIEKWNTIYKP